MLALQHFPPTSQVCPDSTSKTPRKISYTAIEAKKTKKLVLQVKNSKNLDGILPAIENILRWQTTLCGSPSKERGFKNPLSQ